MTRFGSQSALGRFVVSAVALVGLGDVTRDAVARSRESLLRSGEMPGFTLKSEPATWVSARSLVAAHSGARGAGARRLEELREAGFILAAREQLRAPGVRSGHSNVHVFNEAKGAAAFSAKRLGELAEDLGAHGVLTHFSVPGVASARGLTAQNDPHATAIVLWAHGPYAFSSGFWMPDASGMSAADLAEPLIIGTQSQYQRIESNP